MKINHYLIVSPLVLTSFPNPWKLHNMAISGNDFELNNMTKDSTKNWINTDFKITSTLLIQYTPVQQPHLCPKYCEQIL